MKRSIVLCALLAISTLQANALTEVNGYLNLQSQPNIAQIIKVFQDALPSNINDSIMYTVVPRGLIISITDDQFFSNGSTTLTENGKIILFYISNGLNKLKNNCAIESHTDAHFSENSIYKEDWEISIKRATRIANFLTLNCKIEKRRLFPIGFGDIMPFKENVFKQNFQDNRIDFVIFDYVYKR